MSITKEEKAFHVAAIAALLATVDKVGDSSNFSAQEYSDIVVSLCYALPEFNTKNHGFEDLSNKYRQVDNLICVLEAQDRGHNFNGMYGPATIRRDLRQSVNRVGGQNLKALMEKASSDQISRGSMRLAG